ncbi:MAG: hypothetical protein ABFC38_13245 [Methanospirillum sp.]
MTGTDRELEAEPDDLDDYGYAEETEYDEGEWYEPADELEATADSILEECEEDVACVAVRLDELEDELRWELLDSNLLNAWQVFYYFYRIFPDELVRERLELEPALAARTGVLLEARDLFELIFYVKARRAFIGVSDGKALLAHFEGPDAFEDARAYVDANA